MSRLILHIGTHKTGTTAIQRWLGAHRAALHGQGVHYGATHRPPHPGMPKHTSLYRALADRDPGHIAAEFDAILADHAASGQPDLVLSEEGLSLPAFRAFAPLRRLAERFDEAQVVVLLRRQDRFIESHWNQLCKEGQTCLSLAAFARRDWHRRRMEYDRILDFWAGFAEVRARAYDPACPGGAVAQFLEAARLPLDAGPSRRANPSPPMNAAALCAVLNRYRLSRLNPVVLRAWPRDGRRHGLGRHLRDQILAEVAEGNRRLEARHGVRFDTDRPAEPDIPVGLPRLPWPGPGGPPGR